MLVRCRSCFGSCEQRGSMGLEPCAACKGTGEIDDSPKITVSNVVIDKRSKSYKDAIKKLVALGLTHTEAEKQFENQSIH